MQISLSDIHKYTHTKGVVTEIGGYFEQASPNGPIRFYKTTESVIKNGNSRHSLMLPNGGMVWHAHPYHAGWWPSYEDLTRRHDNVHVLFGFNGVWIYKPARSRQTLPRHEWVRFHKYMMSLGTHWDGNEFLQRIDQITSDFRTNYGLEIKFLPYFVHGLFTNNLLIRKYV